MIPQGRSATPYIHPDCPGRPVTIHAYRPASHTPSSPVVLVHHGMGRNGDEYRDAWIPAADRHGLLILAPTFSNDAWPGSRTYNDGHVRDADCAPRPRAAWSNAIPASIFRMVQDAGLTTRTQAFIWGHSAGGQFVHRLIALQPHAPFMAAGAANAGWYTMPDLETPYPRGLGGIGLDETDLARFLAYPLTIFAGDQDNDSSAENLPNHPAAAAQGPHRFARAHAFLAAGRAEAARRGLPCHWRLVPIPGIGHQGMQMSAAAAAYWFDAADHVPTAVTGTEP